MGAFPILAQVPNTSAPVKLKPITVNATRSEKQLDEIPNALTAIKRENGQKFLPGATLDEFGRGTPGVFFQNQFNYAQDLRISIRGFGSRSPFGVRGIHVRIDGIPQTLPDGQTQLDSIDPSLIDQMNILRGPSASLFGNASGGMIGITTRGAPNKKFTLEPRQVFGQFGYFKSEIYAGGRKERFDYSVFGSHLQQKGWRDHSNVENNYSQIKLNFKTRSDSDWMVVLREFYSPKSNDPGGLTNNQVRNDPRQAGPRNLSFNTGEEVRQEQLGIRYRKIITAKQTLNVTAHLLHRDFQNRLPFVNGGQVAFDRWVGGLAVEFVSDHMLFNQPNRFLAGIDYGIQNDDRKRYNNDYGIRDALALNQTERVQSIGPFLRNELRLTNKLDLVVGARWDWLHYRVQDDFRTDGNQSGSRTLSQASGTTGLVYHLTDQHQIYTNVASIFEAPTTTELINNPTDTGGFNSNLTSQRSLSQELGLRGTPAGFQYETTLFHIFTWNEITSFELQAFPGRPFFRNSGRSRRLGVETRIATPDWNGLRAEMSYTYSNFTFEKFMVDNVSLKGNSFPGVPKYRWEGRIRYTHSSGIYAQLYMQHVGQFFVNNANNTSNAAYNLGQLLFGWEKKHDLIEGAIFIGINNLFDERYNANTRINAAFGRFFEPGPPFNVYGGLSLRIIPF